jgi:hypothetical protein
MSRPFFVQIVRMISDEIDGSLDEPHDDAGRSGS